MFEKLTAKHRREVAGALDRMRYEVTDDGRVFMPEQGLFIGGAFTHSVNGGDLAIDPNLWVSQGMLDLFKCYFNGTTARTNLYIAPYSTNVAPTAALVASDFAAVQGEFINYTEANRPAWNKGTISVLPATNTASPARFTIGDPLNGDTIRGAALLSSSAKSSGTGVLVVCSAFAAARTGLQQNDKLDIEYALTATSA